LRPKRGSLVRPRPIQASRMHPSCDLCACVASMARHCQLWRSNLVALCSLIFHSIGQQDSGPEILVAAFQIEEIPRTRDTKVTRPLPIELQVQFQVSHDLFSTVA